ncbi:MAG: winged helix-turn-helix transcriptional regulator [Ardenticatenaceae bacterium]|nr:winged helix-turn-helix transcriptional regulator [Ardenticatenaceae bacterium]
MTQFEMNQLAAELGLPPRFFVTRDKGEIAFAQLAVQLQATLEEGSLILQFPPNQIMDVSFADETIIRLGQAIVKGEYGRRRLLLSGLTQDSIDNINAAIRLQRLKLAFLAIGDEGLWEVVGHLEDSLREVLAMLAERPSLTAPELSEELGMALNSANNRLKRLYDQYLIQREYEVSEKGLIYIYQFWHWEETG